MRILRSNNTNEVCLCYSCLAGLCPSEPRYCDILGVHSMYKECTKFLHKLCIALYKFCTIDVRQIIAICVQLLCKSCTNSVQAIVQCLYNKIAVIGPSPSHTITHCVSAVVQSPCIEELCRCCTVDIRKAILGIV